MNSATNNDMVVINIDNDTTCITTTSVIDNDGADEVLSKLSQHTTASTETTTSPTPNERKEASLKDLCLYFLLGGTTLLLKGLSITPAFSKAIGVQSNQLPQSGLAFALGALLGMVLVTSVYTRLRPKVRVATSAALEILGLLGMLIPVHPVNWWLGILCMSMGIGSMVGTIMPLTSYASGNATKVFQLGFALSNLLGAIVSKLLNVPLPKFVIVLIIILFPLLNVVAFFSLDQSPWAHIGITIDDSNNVNASDNDEDTDEENLSKISPVRSTSSHSTLSIDSATEHDDNDDSATSEGNTTKDGPLSKEEILCAAKQMVFRYWPIFLLAGITNQIFQLTLLFPFESSSFTHGGMPASQVNTVGSTLTIVAFSCSFLVGMLVVTKIGKGIAKMSPFFLWAPTTIMLSLVSMVYAGVVLGAYEPLPNAPYGIYPVVFVSYQFIQIYSPLIIRNDTKVLSPRYTELHLQSIFMMNYLSVFVVSILGSAWLAEHVYDRCGEHYEQDYEGVSCTAMLGATSNSTSSN